MALNLPFDLASGEITVDIGGENYNDITFDFMKKKIAADKGVVLVNAGTPGAFAYSRKKGVAGTELC